jgi:hypothetical protein
MLKKHALVFIEQITPEEFDRQKLDYTEQQVAALQASQEYKKMLRQKGKKVEQWNWQAKERKNGAEFMVEDEYDIISNYGFSSEDDAKSVGKASTRSKGRPKKAETQILKSAMKKSKTVS